MKEYTLGILLVAAAGVALMGVTATRWLHVNAAPRRSSPIGRAPGQERVVRFASNGTPAPPFLVPDLDGNIISTADWHGKVVLLNFWATWCPPCREEIPELTDLADRYKGQLQIIGVAMDDAPPEEVRVFTKRFGVNFSVIMASPEMVDEYGGVPALPTSFLINREGRVVQKHVGLYPIEVYDTEIRALLGLPVDARVETFQDTGQIFLKNAALATELPGVDFKGLTDSQKKEALKRLNSEMCDCPCHLTLAQCRINDSGCPISRQIANKIVKEILSGTSTSAPASQSTTQ
jgi:thiol-disulfide isomerase/thioredoxin